MIWILWNTYYYPLEFNQDDRMASNDDGIEWQANTFDAVLDTNKYRILMIFISF